MVGWIEVVTSFIRPLLTKGTYMSNVFRSAKDSVLDLMEQDAEWSRHLHQHGLHPSMNCGFCVSSAEEVYEELEPEEVGGEV